ncbi:hypothetical protein ACFV6G_37720 [Streptomyces lavendulae]|uniref:hypothetical protein n=1 Tax=Streptomyces lavendulae TaxID=1914 RepID=UPI0036CE3A88
MTRTPFDPEMNGGLQLGLDLDLFGDQQHAAGPEDRAAPAVSGPTEDEPEAVQ